MLVLIKKLLGIKPKLNHKSHPIGTVVVIGYVGGLIPENASIGKRHTYRREDVIREWSQCKRSVKLTAYDTWYSVDELNLLGVVSNESPYVNITFSKPTNESKQFSFDALQRSELKKFNKHNSDISDLPPIIKMTLLSELAVSEQLKLKEQDKIATDRLNDAISELKTAQELLDKAKKGN